MFCLKLRTPEEIPLFFRTFCFQVWKFQPHGKLIRQDVWAGFHIQCTWYQVSYFFSIQCEIYANVLVKSFLPILLCSNCQPYLWFSLFSFLIVHLQSGVCKDESMWVRILVDNFSFWTIESCECKSKDESFVWEYWWINFGFWTIASCELSSTNSP